MKMTNPTKKVFFIVGNETVTHNATGGYAWTEYGSVYDRARNLLMQPHQCVALILGFLAISLNFISILAVLKTRRTLTSHYWFIISLAISDIFVGVSVTVYIINRVLNPTHPIGQGSWNFRLVTRCAYIVIKALNTTSLCITLLNLMCMALDHYLAILRPLHYPYLMNPARAQCLIYILWFLALLCGFSDFMSAFPKFMRYKDRYNYCEFVFLTKYQEEYALFFITLICLVVMIFTYVQMLIAVKKRHQYVGPVGPDISRNKKAMFTTLLILGTFILCWLPTCLFQIILVIQVKIDQTKVWQIAQALYRADQYLLDLLLLNAILDPIIYAVRMRDVQAGYRKMFCGCCNIFKSGHHPNADVTHTSLITDQRGETFQMSVR